MAKITTPFSCVYDSFLSKITDDMYMELSELETFKILQDLLISAIPKFEFPRVTLDYEEEYIEDEVTYNGVDSNNIEVKAFIFGGGYFLNSLTKEEINILATYMIVEWLGIQLASIENTRMKYTGSDFKMTSQANHMAKIKVLKEQYTKENFHMQRLYKRRKLVDGQIVSTIGQIMEKPSYGWKGGSL